MTSPNEPVQPVGYVAPPAQGGNASGGGGTFAPPAFAPPAYTPPAFASPTAQPGMNTMAVLALVFSFLISPLGVIFGFIGRRQISRTGERGKGLATAGLIVGVIFTLLGTLLVVRLATAQSYMPKSTLERNMANEDEKTGPRPDSVSCATDLVAIVGSTDLCTKVTAGTSTVVKITVTSVDGGTLSYRESAP